MTLTEAVQDDEIRRYCINGLVLMDCLPHIAEDIWGSAVLNMLERVAAGRDSVQDKAFDDAKKARNYLVTVCRRLLRRDWKQHARQRTIRVNWLDPTPSPEALCLRFEHEQAESSWHTCVKDVLFSLPLMEQAALKIMINTPAHERYTMIMAVTGLQRPAARNLLRVARRHLRERLSTLQKGRG